VPALRWQNWGATSWAQSLGRKIGRIPKLLRSPLRSSSVAEIFAAIRAAIIRAEAIPMTTSLVAAPAAV
jgi:hypothetical protein